MSQGDNDHENNKASHQPEVSGDSSDKNTVPSSGDRSTKDTKGKTTKKGRSGSLLFVFILILLAFCGGGYGAYYYLNEQMLEREMALSTGLQRVDEGFSRLEKSDQDLGRRQSDLQRAITAAVSDNEKQMTALAERLSASESAGPDDWTLAEVEYLLRIANQRLVTSRDNKTAVEMLKEADSILKELAYPELVNVRKQLAADITALQLANQVDTEGIYFTLESMFAEVARLDHFSPEELETVKPSLDQETSRLGLLWNKVVEVLSRYVRIDTSAGEPEYLITDEEEVVRRLAIQLQIRQAQLALLSGQQEIYSTSLKSAAETIRSSYETDNQSHDLAAALAELASREIDPEPMNVNLSIRLLSDVIDTMSKVHAQGER